MKKDVKRIAGLLVLAGLLVGIAVLGVRVAGLVNMTQEEMRTTPTPVPQPRNVMQVTVEPSAATVQLLRSGSQGEAVRALQTRLQELGYYTDEVDGQFGQGTKSAVMAFQRQNGLDADGIVGAGTQAALQDENAQPKPSPTAEPDLSAFAPKGEMPILVNREHRLPEDYQPRELVDMSTYCSRDVVIIKYDGTQGERQAVDALLTMLKAAQQQGISVWQVSAAYRSEAYQQQLFDEQVQDYMDESKNGLSYKDAVRATRLTVMEPGYSEHHTGLAFDVTVPGVAFKGTEQAQWLEDNCWQYGFILRYTADKEDVTGILAEPWHIRYVGVEHSLLMRQMNLCLEEYIALYGSN